LEESVNDLNFSLGKVSSGTGVWEKDRNTCMEEVWFNSWISAWWVYSLHFEIFSFSIDGMLRLMVEYKHVRLVVRIGSEYGASKVWLKGANSICYIIDYRYFCGISSPSDLRISLVPVNFLNIIFGLIINSIFEFDHRWQNRFRIRI
jgi:hypothetical protein